MATEPERPVTQIVLGYCVGNDSKPDDVQAEPWWVRWKRYLKRSPTRFSWRLSALVQDMSRLALPVFLLATAGMLVWVFFGQNSAYNAGWIETVESAFDGVVGTIIFGGWFLSFFLLVYLGLIIPEKDPKAMARTRAQWDEEDAQSQARWSQRIDTAGALSTPEEPKGQGQLAISSAPEEGGLSHPTGKTES